MVKKTVKVIKTVCDFCGKEAHLHCELCGKDVCNACARWICNKEYRPVSGGPCITPGWSNPYAEYPWEWSVEKTICKDCCEKFKMSIAILAGKK